MSKSAYAYEFQLVNDFRESLGKDESPLKIRNFAQEFNYGNGKTDIVGISNDGDVVAFEAKLDKWKVALHQAYKYSAFAAGGCERFCQPGAGGGDPLRAYGEGEDGARIALRTRRREAAFIRKNWGSDGDDIDGSDETF